MPIFAGIKGKNKTGCYLKPIKPYYITLMIQKILALKIFGRKKH
jgi:hypothetical protein